MKRVRQMCLVLAASAGLGFAAAPVHAHPGGAMGMGAQGQGQAQAQGQRADMHSRMAQHMKQHQGGEGRGQKGAAANDGCPMGAQASSQSEHKH